MEGRGLMKDFYEQQGTGGLRGLEGPVGFASLSSSEVVSQCEEEWV